MTTTLTIEIDKELAQLLEKSSLNAGKTQKERVLDALKRQLALENCKTLQSELRPYGKVHGWESDEDVFCEIS